MPEAGDGHSPEREATGHGRRSPAALRRVQLVRGEGRDLSGQYGKGGGECAALRRSGRGERVCVRAPEREGSGARRGGDVVVNRRSVQ